MRKHLANALKTRSKSIQAAIDAYNTAARALSPPREQVAWDDILEFSFLSEFDILRDARSDVREKKWATQKNRVLMQQFFKLLSAETELMRLHTEIRRMVTYMHDEEQKMRVTAESLSGTNPMLAFQVGVHGRMRSRFNKLHHQRFRAITKLKGFQRAHLVHFRLGTSVIVEDARMDAEDGFNNAGDAEEDEEDIDPDLLHATDDTSITQDIELIMEVVDSE